jgi:ADP-ribose pyrophosphatase YjhB (NUDIX family)
VTLRFCTACGGSLAGEPATCTSCGEVHYLDPKVAACVIVRWEGEILLLKRSISPGKGLWTYPGGYVDRGETVETAARREAAEEAGLEVRLDRLVGVYSYAGQTPVIIVYAGTVTGGRPQALSECSEARTFADDAIPWSGLAFPSTADALKDYLAGDGADGAPAAGGAGDATA